MKKNTCHLHSPCQMETDPEDKGVPIQIRRRQIPVRPAFAMTINEAK